MMLYVNRLTRWIVLAITLCLAVVFWWFASQAWFASVVPNAPRVRIEITSGMTVREVSTVLYDAGLIASPWAYRLYAWRSWNAQHPKVGVYSLSADSFRNISTAIAAGPTREEVKITMVEGRTIRDAKEQLQTIGVDPAAYLSLVGESLESKPFALEWIGEFPFLSLLPANASLEGYLFPDTYRVWKDELPKALVRKQLAEFETYHRKWDEAVSRQGLKWHEMVTLASIVEKEVAKPEDRKIVAGIFWRRLREGMRLQSDATVNYVLRTGRTRPTHADIDVNSPYNTYKIDGLPPGPISNPSAGALEATIFPTASEYRYFLTDESGKAYYARTFEEHIRNRRRAFGE